MLPRAPRLERREGQQRRDRGDQERDAVDRRDGGDLEEHRLAAWL